MAASPEFSHSKSSGEKTTNTKEMIPEVTPRRKVTLFICYIPFTPAPIAAPPAKAPVPRRANPTPVVGGKKSEPTAAAPPTNPSIVEGFVHGFGQ